MLGNMRSYPECRLVFVYPAICSPPPRIDFRENTQHWNIKLRKVDRLAINWEIKAIGCFLKL